MTVLFCDVVVLRPCHQCGSGDSPSSIARFYRVTTEVVAAHDGHLGRLVGDGVLIYFGYPMAQEDDAERAVRAALGILDAVAALPTRSGQPLAVRIGISTGLVVVADVADTGDPRNLDISARRRTSRRGCRRWRNPAPRSSPTACDGWSVRCSPSATSARIR